MTAEIRDDDFNADAIRWGNEAPRVEERRASDSFYECKTSTDLVIRQLMSDVLAHEDTIRALVDIAADLTYENFIARWLAKNERRERIHAEAQLGRMRRIMARQRHDGRPVVRPTVSPHIAAVAVRGLVVQVTRR